MRTPQADRRPPLARRPRWLNLLAAGLLAAALAVAGATPVAAQLTGRGAPSETYFARFPLLAEGEYRDALEGFTSDLRGGIKEAGLLWIDSICYHTMRGECFYQLGDLRQAMESYTAALQIYVNFPDWMLRVQFPPGLTPAGAGAVKRVPWGASTRQAPVGQFGRKYLISQGQIDQSAVVQQGGVVRMASLYPVNPYEVCRCTALALRRRMQILGPLAPLDKLNVSVATAMLRPIGQRNHWSECWTNLELGTALLATGREAQAKPLLERAVLAQGQYDHPLTADALLTLGQLYMAQGDYPAALKYFGEASYSAVNFPSAAILEEAFRNAGICHFLSNQKGLLPPLAKAIPWAKRENLRQLYVTLSLLAAENYLMLNQPREAVGVLKDAHVVIGRRGMNLSRSGAWYNYVAAAGLYEEGKIPDGDASVAAAMKFMRTGSTWLYQIAAVDNAYVQGEFTLRQAVTQFERALRDPEPKDWLVEPMEAMATLVTPHPLPLEHWFGVAMERKEYETAIQIGDRMRRHRFFSSLPFGGRLQSMRWLMAAPEEALSPSQLLTRHDLLLHYPQYEQRANESQKLIDDLRKQPLTPGDPAGIREQIRQFTQLAADGQRQELLLREMAVRREPAELCFPPLRSTQDIENALLPGQALLIFTATSRNLYGFLLRNGRDAYKYWNVGDPAGVQRKVAELLRDMGNYEQNHDLTLKDLVDTRWKSTGGELLDVLAKGAQLESQNIDELIIVPDGALWYVPFEALPMEVDKTRRPFLARFRIRYLPTASLAIADGRGRKPTARTGVVVGQMLNRESESLARAMFDDLAKALPGTAALPAPLPASSRLYAPLLERLVVMDQVALPEQDPYAWSPIPTDRGKSGGLLTDWMSMPWTGPETILLPALLTPAGSGLKRINAATAGNDVFFSVCGLLASGSRTVLLSRWRTGGQTACDLTREFAQELPHTTASDAWKRAVFLCADSRVNVESEPRIHRTADETAPKATHPFFWSGYMLVDTAGEGRKEPPPDDPVLKPKPVDPANAAAGPARPEQPAAARPADANTKRSAAQANQADDDNTQGPAPKKSPKSKRYPKYIQ